jgi:hypothetical protein
MAEREALTAEYVRQILHYDPDTGVFTWRERTPQMFRGVIRDNIHAAKAWNNKNAGNRTGSYSAGYVLIVIHGVFYKAHRLAWLYMMGEWPKHEIDHIDLDRSNNSFCNLREATRSQNSANTPLRRDNTSGYKGVKWNAKLNKWRACIQYNNKQYHLGCFEYIEDASKAYACAAERLHAEFARLA